MNARALLAAAICAVALAPALAQDGTPVALDVGTTQNLCTSGVVPCPVTMFMCDDPKVARIENGPAGTVLRGVSPGKTVCAVTGSAGTFRRILQVTVEAPKPGGGGTPSH